MRLVCSECKKSYDYDVDDFCPRCGAYNQPPKTTSTAAVRRDGINEQGHKGSFVHKEVHKEKAQRRAIRQIAKPLGNVTSQRNSTSKGTSIAVIVVMIVLVIILQVLAQLF